MNKWIYSRTSLTPKYAFTPHTLATPPAITSAVATLNALRVYKTPLNPSSLEMRGEDSRSEASEDPRNGTPVFADGVPVIDVGGVCVDAIRDDVGRLTGGGEIEWEGDMCLLNAEVDERCRRRRANGRARAAVVMTSC
jgi:hypothetical protein